MVIPGGDNWKNNKYFRAGVQIEVREYGCTHKANGGVFNANEFLNSTKSSGEDVACNYDGGNPVLFGPYTVRSTVSKQFSYGKQTFVYWKENVRGDYSLTYLTSRAQHMCQCNAAVIMTGTVDYLSRCTEAQNISVVGSRALRPQCRRPSRPWTCTG